MNSLPQELIQSLRNIESFNEETFKAVHESGGQITSIRLNPKKIGNRQSAIGNEQLERVPWNEYGYYLNERPSFTLDPLVHAGAYYVQEASSMFLEEALKQTVDLAKPLKVLDLCAAPGGKSTLIQSIISAASLLVSNEVIKTRVHILAENITKWGAANVIVTNNDPSDFQRLPGYFDVIVVDAPCSGSGLFRKDPAAIDEWSENNVLHCAQRQHRILEHVIPALKDGGILIYSTCSYSAEEDEMIADWLMDNYSLETARLNVNTEWNIIETISPEKNAYGYRFYPDRVKGEGFFVAVFSNGNRFVEESSRNTKNKLPVTAKQEQQVLSKWINSEGNITSFAWQDDLLLVHEKLLPEIRLLQSILYLKKAGINAGSIIRDELIPSHELAMSTLVRSTIPFIEVDHEMAMQFLRRVNFFPETDLKGWALIKYKGLALGWIKILASRINNYYPKDWRILNK